MTLHVLELFAGVGGFGLGLERAGATVVGACEIDKAARGVYADHWPDVPLYPDVTELTASDLPTRVDLIAAGFPCQDLSVAGRRRGLGGARSGLFFEVVRLADETRAPWLLLENVAGLLSSNGGRDMGAVVGALAECGYGWAYRILDAQHFGVPQRRRRVIIVGHLGDAGAPAEILLEPEGSPRHPRPRGGARPDAAAGADARAPAAGGDGAGDGDAEGGAGDALVVRTGRSQAAGPDVNVSELPGALSAFGQGEANQAQYVAQMLQTHHDVDRRGDPHNLTDKATSVQATYGETNQSQYVVEQETAATLTAAGTTSGRGAGADENVVAPTVVGQHKGGTGTTQDAQTLAVAGALTGRRGDVGADDNEAAAGHLVLRTANLHDEDTGRVWTSDKPGAVQAIGSTPNQADYVVQPASSTGDGLEVGPEGDPAGTLRASSGGGSREMVAVSESGLLADTGVVSALKAEDPHGVDGAQAGHIVAPTVHTASGSGIDGQHVAVARTLLELEPAADVPDDRDDPRPGPPVVAPTMTAGIGGDGGFTGHSGGDDMIVAAAEAAERRTVPALTSDDSFGARHSAGDDAALAVAATGIDWQQQAGTVEDGSPTLSTTRVPAVQGGAQQDQFVEPGSVSPSLAHSGAAHQGHHEPKVMGTLQACRPATSDDDAKVVAAAAIRRLTPTECERLQGFPDGWTETSRGQAQADSARYRQMGNAVAVPVVEWVGRRIVAAADRV